MPITVYCFGDDDEELEINLPTHMEVCPTCHGKGTHVNPAVDGHGITREEMDELGDEFMDDYFAGVYDVVCHECNGRNVVEVPDELPPEHPLFQALNLYYQELQDRYDDERTRWYESGCPR